MHTHGLNNSACKLLGSYFKDGYHRVQMGTARSDWLRLTKGTPQGIRSVMGPFAYNVYTNDLIMLLSAMYNIFSYADDNTACYYDDCTAEVIRRLEKVASDMITWFRLNEMKINGNKFQLIIINRQVIEKVSIHIDGHVIVRKRIASTCEKKYLVRTTYYVVRTTYYLVRTTYYVVRTTYYLVRTTYYVIRTTYYLVRTTYYLVRTTYYLVRTT